MSVWKKLLWIAVAALGTWAVAVLGAIARRTNQRVLDRHRRVLRVIDQLSFLQQMAGDKGARSER